MLHYGWALVGLNIVMAKSCDVLHCELVGLIHLIGFWSGGLRFEPT